jgi:hypothetical protein
VDISNSTESLGACWHADLVVGSVLLNMQVRNGSHLGTENERMNRLICSGRRSCLNGERYTSLSTPSLPARVLQRRGNSGSLYTPCIWFDVGVGETERVLTAIRLADELRPTVRDRSAVSTYLLPGSLCLDT